MDGGSRQRGPVAHSARSPENFGEEKEEELLSSMSRLFYHMRREKGEKSVQFLPRFREASRKVALNGVILPEEAIGFLLINAYGYPVAFLDRANNAQG